MPPQLLSQIMSDAPMGGAPARRKPAREPDPFARPYDPPARPPQPQPEQRPQAPPTEEEAAIIEGLLKSGQFNDIYDLAMQDARRPSIYMFDRSGGIRGAVDAKNRLGYGALASLLGADADRYAENNQAQMFADEMDLRRMPYQQMTAADQALADHREADLQQRMQMAQMPYDRMTPFEEGTLDLQRAQLMSPQGRGGLSELDQQFIASDPAMQAQYKADLQQRIFGDAPPPAPGALREIIADKVNDDEVSSIVQEAVPELKTMSDYSEANRVTAETLMEQVKAGDRGWESALQAARTSDANSPAGAASTVEALKQMKTKYDKVQQTIRETRERLSAPETGAMEGIPYLGGGAQW